MSLLQDWHSLNPFKGFSRRDFLQTSLGSGFAAAALPVMSQTVISTPSTGLLSGEVTISVKGFNVPAYRAQPLNAKNPPVVLVISEIFGVHEHIADVCRRLAHQGYMAIAPELFVRQGNPKSVGSMAELMETIISKVPDAQVIEDLDTTVAWAKAQGGNTTQLFITGFCWGGRITWLYAAHQAQLKAAVAWYGRLLGNSSSLTPQHPVDLTASIKAPVLGLYASEDTGIPLESVEKMKAALATGSAQARASQFHIYPKVGHAFHADYRPSYNKEAAMDGWSRCLAWFKQHA